VCERESEREREREVSRRNYAVKTPNIFKRYIKMVLEGKHSSDLILFGRRESVD
jgi:hypothetical protein